MLTSALVSFFKFMHIVDDTDCVTKYFHGLFETCVKIDILGPRNLKMWHLKVLE